MNVYPIQVPLKSISCLRMKGKYMYIYGHTIYELYEKYGYVIVFAMNYMNELV
ncbi:hypothetical protein F383_17163 [Gossypium arboreum]|uniref:Uncharacterized protein n=1 Tax=Gossypium arboreum TaxID=29729 RepID=A0A0B0NMZ8_GOSAR|nr:hypothetical protein F383_17163 [Gossypium arboreum]